MAHLKKLMNRLLDYRIPLWSVLIIILIVWRIHAILIDPDRYANTRAEFAIECEDLVSDKLQLPDLAFKKTQNISKQGKRWNYTSEIQMSNRDIGLFHCSWLQEFDKEGDFVKLPKIKIGLYSQD